MLTQRKPATKCVTVKKQKKDKKKRMAWRCFSMAVWNPFSWWLLLLTTDDELLGSFDSIVLITATVRTTYEVAELITADEYETKLVKNHVWNPFFPLLLSICVLPLSQFSPLHLFVAKHEVVVAASNRSGVIVVGALLASVAETRFPFYLRRRSNLKTRKSVSTM
jgi:hypothetical protein